MAANRGQDFISVQRRAVRKIWDGLHELLAAQDEWSGGDYLNTLPPGSGDNAGITAAFVGSAVFDTANALATALTSGHKTNLVRLL